MIAAGGIFDGRGGAAALMQGVSAVQMDTALLATDETRIPGAWKQALATVEPEYPRVNLAFSGRLGRSLGTAANVRAADAAAMPLPQPYPVQCRVIVPMRQQATIDSRLDAMQAWAGQSARGARSVPAAGILRSLWTQARESL